MDICSAIEFLAMAGRSL